MKIELLRQEVVELREDVATKRQANSTKQQGRRAAPGTIFRPASKLLTAQPEEDFRTSENDPDWRAERRTLARHLQLENYRRQHGHYPEEERPHAPDPPPILLIWKGPVKPPPRISS
jgi:hypothetical protein